jgi:hypothetical protein
MRVLNQVLDLSKIEAGRMELVEGTFSPRRLVSDATDLARPQALERGLALKLEVDWPADLDAVADEMRLRQILLNFLSKPKSLIGVIALEQQLTAALGRKVDLLTEDALSPYLRESMLRDLLVVYEA